MKDLSLLEWFLGAVLLGGWALFAAPLMVVAATRPADKMKTGKNKALLAARYRAACSGLHDEDPVGQIIQEGDVVLKCIASSAAKDNSGEWTWIRVDPNDPTIILEERAIVL